MIFDECGLVLVHLHAQTPKFLLELIHTAFDLPQSISDLIYPASEISPDFPTYISDLLKNNGHRLTESHVIKNMAAIAIAVVLLLLISHRGITEYVAL